MSTTTLSKAKKNLDSLLDEAVNSSERVIIRRAGKPDIALIPVAKLKSELRVSRSELVVTSAADRKRLDAAFAELDAGRYAWEGTLEELKSFIALKVKERKSASKTRRAT